MRSLLTLTNTFVDDRANRPNHRYSTPDGARKSGGINIQTGENLSVFPEQ